jgi:hypothetical protein
VGSSYSQNVPAVDLEQAVARDSGQVQRPSGERGCTDRDVEPEAKETGEDPGTGALPGPSRFPNHAGRA